MFILVTGISGLERKRAYELLPKDYRVINLGDYMIKIAKECAMTLDEHNILHAGRDTLAALRAAAICRARSECESGKPGDLPIILSTHSVFSGLHGLVAGLTSRDVKEIKHIKCLITLIDGPQAIKERLRNHKAEYLQHKVWDVVRWQELEVFFSHHLAGELDDVRHYVVPTTQPDVFAAICQGDKRKTAYVSFPMTHASNSAKEKITKFKERLKEHFIVVDPAAIESSHATGDDQSIQDRNAVWSHTIVRDLEWFIGISADTVIAYWPEVTFSSGMSDELRYAFVIGKSTVLVTEHTKMDGLPVLSPFQTYKSTVFWSSDEYFEFLGLSDQDREIYSLCQAVMTEQFRAHESHMTELDLDFFKKESKRVAKYRLTEEALSAVNDRLSDIAETVFRSWEPQIDRASQPKTSQ